MFYFLLPTDPFPENVLAVTDYDETTVTVTWAKEPDKVYIALFKEVSQLSEEYSASVESSDSTSSILSHTYEELVPGRHYEFIVRPSDSSSDIYSVQQRTGESSHKRAILLKFKYNV